MEDLQRFQPHDDRSFMEHTDFELMQAVYAGQWSKIQFEIRGVLDARGQEEVPDLGSVVCESMEMISQRPRLRAPLPTLSTPIETNHRPTQEMQPQTNRRGFTLSACCSFFSRPLSFMASTRAASMGVVPIAFDHV